MNRPSKTPGICRIDQPEKRTHGFFMQMRRKDKIHSAFFTDLRHGCQAEALAAAQQHQLELTAKLGIPVQRPRRAWAEIWRRKGSCSIVGVQRIVVRRSKRPVTYWKATWSPEPHVVRRKMFSEKKFGARKAKRLAFRARQAGLRRMEPVPRKPISKS